MLVHVLSKHTSISYMTGTPAALRCNGQKVPTSRWGHWSKNIIVFHEHHQTWLLKNLTWSYLFFIKFNENYYSTFMNIHFCMKSRKIDELHQFSSISTLQVCPPIWWKSSEQPQEAILRSTGPSNKFSLLTVVCSGLLRFELLKEFLLHDEWFLWPPFRFWINHFSLRVRKFSVESQLTWS